MATVEQVARAALGDLAVEHTALLLGSGGSTIAWPSLPGSCACGSSVVSES